MRFNQYLTYANLTLHNAIEQGFISMKIRHNITYVHIYIHISNRISSKFWYSRNRVNRISDTFVPAMTMTVKRNLSTFH